MLGRSNSIHYTVSTALYCYGSVSDQLGPSALNK